MKKGTVTILAILLSLAIIAAEARAQEEGTQKEEKKGIGLNFSLDYYSNYLWRGTVYYNGDGAFVPTISWDAFDTGLTLSVSSEIAASYVWNGFQKKPTKIYPAYDAAGALTFKRKNRQFNHTAYALNSLDVGLDYSYTIKKAVTLGASVWYWWYYNSRYAKELAKPQAEGYNLYAHTDVSFLTAAFSIGLDFIPFVNPSLSVTYDYYTALKKGGDIYAQLSFGHDFALHKYVTLNTGISAGYYYFRTGEATRYYLDSSNAMARSRTALVKGFSDITPSITLTYSKDNFTLIGAFNWVIVPAVSWYKGSENHRYFAKLGASYSL